MTTCEPHHNLLRANVSEPIEFWYAMDHQSHCSTRGYYCTYDNLTEFTYLLEEGPLIDIEPDCPYINYEKTQVLVQLYSQGDIDERNLQTYSLEQFLRSDQPIEVKYKVKKAGCKTLESALRTLYLDGYHPENKNQHEFLYDLKSTYRKTEGLEVVRPDTLMLNILREYKRIRTMCMAELLDYYHSLSRDMVKEDKSNVFGLLTPNYLHRLYAWNLSLDSCVFVHTRLNNVQYELYVSAPRNPNVTTDFSDEYLMASKDNLDQTLL